MDSTIIVAIISVLGSILVAVISYAANRKGAKEASETNAKLIAYRLQELEKKVQAHNNLVERTYKLEGQMLEAQHDIRDMKGAR